MSLQTLSEAEKRTLITRYDPTRTTTLRNQFARNMRGRFDRVCAKINKAIIEQDCFGMLSTYQDIPPRRAYDFPRSQDKIAEFLNWLQEQIDNDILEVIPGAQLGQAIERAWTNKFIQSAFQKGIYMARQELKRAGYPIPDNLPEIDVIFNSPFYLERVGLVYTRTYTDLKGITDAMASQISRVLAQGMAEGRNPREIARMLTKTITGPSGDLGLTDILGRFIPAKRRAEMLARTEIIRAHHLAKVQEYRNWGAIDVQVKAEWVTAGYNVCPECASLEGQVFDLDEVEGMLPKHPNCFISWLVPVYTPEGWVKIGNIKVGDKVLTHKGRFRKVTEVIRIPNQRPSVVELNIKDIGKVEITEDHPILVITKEGNKEWKPAKDITTDDQVLKLTIIDSNYGFIPQPILNVRKYIPYKDRILHNLSVEEDESYVAKGIVVHNCRCTIVPVEVEEGVIKIPWTLDDVEEFKKGLTDKEKRQWVAIANSALERCLKEGGDQQTCEVSAIKQANGVAGNKESTYSEITAMSPYTIAVRKHQGEKHLVVPVVMMVEGVHNGSHGPLYHPAEELGKFPESWNGIPVIVRHPQKDGVYVSANSPDIVDDQVIGRVYNTKFEDGKLKAEVWINEHKASLVYPEILSCLRKGQPIDVSVGVFTEDELTPGEWNGEQYIGIAKNHRPDHLALLPNEKGACSLEDGCGLGINKKEGDEDSVNYVNEVSYKGAVWSNTTSNDIGTYRLSYKGTESTEWSGVTLQDFGVEGRWEDLPREERARIASHFLIGDADAPTFQDLKLPVVNPKTGKLNERALRAVISGRGAMVKGVSAEERKRARRQAYRLLIDEFDVDLEIPPMSALKENKKGGRKMEEKVKLLIQSGKFDEKDAEWLGTLQEEHLDKLIDLTKAEPAKIEVNKEAVLEELKEQFKDLNVYLDMAPVEIREQIGFGMKLLQEKKQEYIDYIKTNSASNVFSDDELKSMKICQLEKLAKAIPPKVDYTAMGAQQVNVAANKVKPLPPAGIKFD